MKNKELYYQAFNEKWFERNQRIVLFVFRIIYKIFPSLLFKSEETKDIGNKKIIRVGTNYATCLVDLEKKELKTVFFTDWNYSKMLYNAFKPMWWAMHWWDEIVADRWVPQLSWGFDTLEVNPDADPETNTVDGRIRNTGSDSTWANILSGVTLDKNDTIGQDYIFNIISGAISGWNQLRRGIFLFDTSALTAGATISATIMSLYGYAKADNLSITPTLDIYTSTPASNTALATGDWSQIGTTSQTGSPITYDGWSTTGYNDFTFNATGRGNVSLTGISKFGVRNANYDVANNEPSWTANLSSGFGIYYADNGSNKPKLVVTYTVASGGGEAGLLLRNCQ